MPFFYGSNSAFRSRRASELHPAGLTPDNTAADFYILVLKGTG